MSGPGHTLRSRQRMPLGAPLGDDETHEGFDGSGTRSPLGKLPPDAILLAQAGGTLPTATAPKISTPIPAGATRRRNGSYRLKIGIVAVVLLPDNRTSLAKWKNRAFTRLDIRYTTPSYTFTGDTITTAGQPTVTATIRTTYGPGAKSSHPSGYGKGKTLRDHEGHHGTDYLAYLKAHTPTFTGKTGMSVQAFKDAVKTFTDSLADYVKKAEAESKKETDCTGVKASFCR